MDLNHRPPASSPDALAISFGNDIKSLFLEMGIKSKGDLDS
jgi:hypothetical protein